MNSIHNNLEGCHWWIALLVPLLLQTSPHYVRIATGWVGSRLRHCRMISECTLLAKPWDPPMHSKMYLWDIEKYFYSNELFTTKIIGVKNGENKLQREVKEHPMSTPIPSIDLYCLPTDHFRWDQFNRSSKTLMPFWLSFLELTCFNSSTVNSTGSTR